MNIEWNEDLETGVAVIDDDHKSIIEFYNRIHRYYNGGLDQVLLERAISDFRFHFSLHFLKEENFMAQLSYPDFESHAKEHELMTNLLNHFSLNSSNHRDSCQKIAFLMLQWISSHLEGADRRLAEYARSALRGAPHSRPPHVSMACR